MTSRFSITSLFDNSRFHESNIFQNSENNKIKNNIFLNFRRRLQSGKNPSSAQKLLAKAHPLQSIFAENDFLSIFLPVSYSPTFQLNRICAQKNASLPFITLRRYSRRAQKILADLYRVSFRSSKKSRIIFHLRKVLYRDRKTRLFLTRRRLPSRHGEALYRGAERFVCETRSRSNLHHGTARGFAEATYLFPRYNPSRS